MELFPYTDHIVTQKELFENLQSCSAKNVKFHLKNRKEEEMVLRSVLYVPNYEVILLSVNRCITFDVQQK